MYWPTYGTKPSDSFISLPLPLAKPNDKVVQKQFTYSELVAIGIKCCSMEKPGWLQCSQTFWHISWEGVPCNTPDSAVCGFGQKRKMLAFWLPQSLQTIDSVWESLLNNCLCSI